MSSTSISRTSLKTSLNMDSEKFFIALSQKSKYTQRSYKSILNKYLKYINYTFPFDTVKVKQFQNFLSTKKVSESYFNLVYNVLKFFFSVYGQPFDKTIIIPPKVDVFKQEHPTLSIEDIIKLINNVKINGTDREKVFLSLSTTYGLRNSELCQIAKENIKDGLLYINTQKGGFKRWHLIPEEIQKYIFNYEFKPIPLIEGWVIFNNIYQYLKEKKTQKIGWHSIRRALIKYFVQKANNTEYELNIFFRYNIANNSMINRYARLDIVDPQLKQIDEKIFSIHPFLPIWK